MLLGRGTGDIPYLLKPTVKVFFANSAFFSLFNKGRSWKRGAKGVDAYLLRRP
jgi:hypothetical protein